MGKIVSVNRIGEEEMISRRIGADPTDRQKGEDVEESAVNADNIEMVVRRTRRG
jgi:hypothetical protein